MFGHAAANDVAVLVGELRVNFIASQLTAVTTRESLPRAADLARGVLKGRGRPQRELLDDILLQVQEGQQTRLSKVIGGDE